MFLCSLKQSSPHCTHSPLPEGCWAQCSPPICSPPTGSHSLGLQAKKGLDPAYLERLPGTKCMGPFYAQSLSWATKLQPSFPKVVQTSLTYGHKTAHFKQMNHSLPSPGSLMERTIDRGSADCRLNLAAKQEGEPLFKTHQWFHYKIKFKALSYSKL